MPVPTVALRLLPQEREHLPPTAIATLKPHNLQQIQGLPVCPALIHCCQCVGRCCECACAPPPANVPLPVGHLEGLLHVFPMRVWR